MSRTTDMILEISRANITPDGSKNNLFNIKYNNGSLNVDLAILLPCSDSDFKRLTAFIDKIDVFSDMEAAAGFIWRYVFAMNTELNRIKETYPAGDTKSRAECQKLINRFEKYMQVLTDKYSYMLPEAETEKTPEKRQRAKSADIYTMQADTRAGNAPYITMYSGKIITAPDGVHYGVYKADKGYYKIIDLYTGLSVGAGGHSVAECKEVLTAELCARVAECRTKDNYKIYLSNFAAAMTAAGYADSIIPYSAADPEPAPAPAAEQDNTPAEAEHDEQAEPYNIDYSALLRRFSERYAQLYDMHGSEYGWQTYRDALNMFDNGMNARDIATLRKFVELRHDYVSSDREAAAFIMALIDVLNAPETPETAPEPDNSILPAETETAPETAPETPETAENAPEDPIIEFDHELLEIARYFLYAVYSDTLSADGVQYVGSERGTRGNRLRIYISGSEYETPETVHSSAELYNFMVKNILNAEDYDYLSGIGKHYFEMLAAYTPEPPAPETIAPEPTTGAGTPAGIARTPAGIAGTPADTTGGAPAGMQAETTGGTPGTPGTPAAGIAPAHYITAFSLSMADYIHIYRAGADMSHRTRQNAPRHITAALYPDPVIIAGIPPARFSLPRRDKTASALLYSAPAFMRHRRHAARIDTIGIAPPARKTERQQAIKRAGTRENGAGYIRQCRSTRTAVRQ